MVNTNNIMAIRKISTSVFTVLLLFGLYRPIQGQSYSQTDSIFKDKLDPLTYNTEVRPLVDQSKVIAVHVSFEVVSIVDIDDVAQSFTVNGFLGFSWNDEVVAWDSAVYGGQRVIHPLPEQIWRPRVVLMNTLGARDLFGDDKAPVFVFNTGDTYWAPGSLFPSSCELQLTNYPFDTQTCVIKLVAMKNTVDELLFVANLPNISQTYFITHGEWNIEDTKLNIGSLTSGTLNTSTIEMTFYLRRRPSFLLLNTVLPVVFLSFLNILVFVIPVESGEKIGYGITVTLALSVFMSIVSGMLPRSSLNMPNLTIYLFILLFMSMLTVIDSIIIVFLDHFEEKVALKRKIQRKFKRAFNKVNTLQRTVSSVNVMNDDNPQDHEKNSKSLFGSTDSLAGELPGSRESTDCPQEDSLRIDKYKLIGKHIDAVSFVVFFVFWLVTTLGFMLDMALS
ncbi:unnamed protein product [Lymnaea stagnalis]|uniref:Uncharacterized protein n=1 Tax=Lymnaea stagnalis TaxID=6523 RepID=A0AAV2HRU4_LYMST